MRHELHALMGHEVNVAAIDATYLGVLREITEEDVTLWSSLGWLSVLHTQIKVVRLARQKPQPGQA